jgi:RNA polymerase sigma factor (sigma-70 family)
LHDQVSRIAPLWCLGGVGPVNQIVDLDESRVIEAYPAVRRFAFVVADSDTDPDDLLHEALVGMLSLGSVAVIDDVGAYLRRAVVNVAANHRRSLARRRRAMDRLSAAPQGHDGETMALSDLGDLMRLKPIDRAALYLFVVEGRPHREVASMLGSSETAMRARVSRALRQLRVELTEEVLRGDA